jgi:PhzF family phenazine biosynthesis protein
MKVLVKRVNAFTDSLKGGNPAGVLLNSPALTDKQMAFVSKQLEVSETAFVFPSKKADYKNVFFTPEVEVDLCGHATIATFFTMALEGLFSSSKNVVVTQETKAGILPVYIEFSEDGNLDRVMMAQNRAKFKDIYFDTRKIAESLNISENYIDDSLPSQIVSTGLFTLPICIKSFKVLESIKPDFKKIISYCKDLDVGSFHLFTFETIDEGSLYHARNFPPIYGINEDPVTGTANGALCSYLVKNNIVKGKKFICEQGDIMGRPGRIYVQFINDDVRVGGRAKIVEEREITLK